MKKFNLAIEKGKRYFEQEVLSFYFIVPEFIFKKKDIRSGEYKIEFKNKEKIFLQQNLMIDVESRKVTIENSHEDPLIESNNCFFICGQLTEDLIDKEDKEIECLFYFRNKLLRKEILKYNILRNLFSLNEWNSYVNKYEVYTKKDCVIRVHLGKSDASYYEEDYFLKANNSFNFEKYLEKHEYVAVQCSYEKDFDLEEKHVFKGIKGIFNSNYYIDQEEFVPIFPFAKKYTQLKNKEWLKINNLKELMEYYQKNKEEIKKTFEMDENFIIPYYKKYKTSAIGKLYSDILPKKFHIDSYICKECNKRSQCMQLVPSGLSEIILKKNLMIESFENCSISQLIESKE